ncbi:MAG: response regulator [Gillisia sp.]
MAKIFLVEDDYGLRDLMFFLLKDKEYEVKAFSNATSFTDTITAELPDLIVLDIMLPDGNGVDLCTDLKASPETKNIPVLLMSAHANPSIAEGSGADAFLPKPFDVEQLYESVDKLFQEK